LQQYTIVIQSIDSVHGLSAYNRLDSASWPRTSSNIYYQKLGHRYPIYPVIKITYVRWTNRPHITP